MRANPFALGLPSRRRPRPFALVVYGVTGDLTRKKLIPSLFSLFREGSFDEFRIIGFARRPWTDHSFRDVVNAALDEAAAPADERDVFLQACSYIASDFDDSAGYRRLAELVDPAADLIHYLSTPPDRYEVITARIGEAGLAKRPGAVSRIVVEKPFGRDGRSAKVLNDAIAERFDEESVYRIDHYLGKETVQNIAVLRFGNGIFEPVWNNRYVDYVEITVAESVGVGSRAGYYEGSGAFKDMVQNHLMQLLALTAMEPPSSLRADAIRTEKVKVFRSLRPMDEAAIDAYTVRGRYTEGFVDGERVPSYLQEAGVAPDSKIETFAALCLRLDSWRWSGVPFILRTGKRLSRRLSEIAVHFKKPPLDFFPHGTNDSNSLVFRIQPDEGLTLYLNTKLPGLNDRSRAVSMDFLYGTGFGSPSPDAYERLLLDAIVGDGTLYTRRDEVEASWAFADPIRQAWDAGISPLREYKSGTSGPDEAAGLPRTFGRTWRRL